MYGKCNFVFVYGISLIFYLFIYLGGGVRILILGDLYMCIDKGVWKLCI